MRIKSLAACCLAASWVCSPVAHADGPITYTVEPFDFDGDFGITMTVTQDQFGGKMCPCEKIAYPADGLHNQEGADAIAKVAFKPGDTLMGFSLGVQVISLFMAQHTLPAGVKVLLAGDTLARNQQLVDSGQGIPWDTASEVTMVVNEYDGWSDMPDKTDSPNYWLAVANAAMGCFTLHYYANAEPDNPANGVERRGNITAITIPTDHLPLNDWMRPWDNTGADARDAEQRPLIEDAYTRPHSSDATRAAASGEQVPQPNPWWPQHPEPVADH